ncbi:MAG: Rid family detoxifying hydrolase [Solirubrobacteraceae bacterium]
MSGAEESAMSGTEQAAGDGGLDGAAGITRIATDRAPAAIGPYCQATLAGELLFCSGQLPLDPQTGKPVDGDLGAMTRRCLENLAAVCEEAGTSIERALRLTIYTRELDRFVEVNAAYAEFFGENVPARSTVEVSALPAGARIEIDAIVAARGRVRNVTGHNS